MIPLQNIHDTTHELLNPSTFLAFLPRSQKSDLHLLSIRAAQSTSWKHLDTELPECPLLIFVIDWLIAYVEIDTIKSIRCPTFGRVWPSKFGYSNKWLWEYETAALFISNEEHVATTYTVLCSQLLLRNSNVDLASVRATLNISESVYSSRLNERSNAAQSDSCSKMSSQRLEVDRSSNNRFI